MKKLITIALLFISAFAMGQTAPVAPVQLNQNTLYREPSTGLRWGYNGITYQWYVIPDSTYIRKYAGPGDTLSVDHNFSFTGTTTNHVLHLNFIDTTATPKIVGYKNGRIYTIPYTAGSSTNLGNSDLTQSDPTRTFTVGTGTLNFIGKSGSDSTAVSIAGSGVNMITGNGTDSSYFNYSPSNVSIGTFLGNAANGFSSVDNQVGITSQNGANSAGFTSFSDDHTNALITYQNESSVIKSIRLGDSRDGFTGIGIADPQDHVGLLGAEVFPISGDPAQYLQAGKIDSLIAAGGGGATTIYTGDGSLAGNRVIDPNGHTLVFGSLASGNYIYLDETGGFAGLGGNSEVDNLAKSVSGNYASEIDQRADSIHTQLNLKITQNGNTQGLLMGDNRGYLFDNPVDGLGANYSAAIDTAGSRAAFGDLLIPDVAIVKRLISSGSGGSLTLTGDVTGSGASPIATTLATVNSSPGSFGDATHVAAVTVNGKGLATTVSSTAITFPVTASNTVTFTNKSGNISQWTNDSGYITSAPVYTASNGVIKTSLNFTSDTTFNRTVANSLSLSQLQTKFNNYALTSSLPVAGNPSGLLTFTPSNGSNTAYERTDGLHAIDSTVVRSVSNSRTLAQTQTALNLKANLASPMFTGTVTVGLLSGYIKGTSGVLSAVSSIPYSDITGGPTALTAGRGILIPSTAIILDTTQNYTWGKVQTVQKNGIASTLTDALFLQNNTASTSGATLQISPSLHFGARVWNTTATAADNWVDWINYANAISGTTPSTTLVWAASRTATSTPSYITKMTLDNSGNLTVPGNLVATGGLNSAFVTTSLIGNNSYQTTTANTTINFKNPFSVSGVAFSINAVSHTNSSGVISTWAIQPTYNQTGTAGSNDLLINRTETAIGSGVHNFISAQISGTQFFAVDRTGKINSSSLTASQLVATDASKNLISVNGLITQATADLTAQTAAGNVTTFTVGASTATFNISGYINITAVTVDVIEMQVTYTDENSTSQTANFFTQGATSALLSAIGNSVYPPMTIRAKNGTVITVKTTLTTGTGSITFDAGARITQL